ncbi:hypothetical protein CapIbe_017533 [Capra ibex]
MRGCDLSLAFQWSFLRRERLSSCLTEEPAPPASPFPACRPQDGRDGEKSTATRGTVCLECLLFTCSCCFWLAGLASSAVGI